MDTIVVIKSLIVFAGWTVTSFLCHYFAKLYLTESSDCVGDFKYNVIILTCIQAAFCLILRPVTNVAETKATKEKCVILASHACATLATNYSMAVTHAASTFAIKMTELLTGALLQKLFLGLSLSSIQWTSIPITVYGAIVFAEDSYGQVWNISLGTSLAFLSNISLALRNVFIKKKHQSNIEIAPNDKLYNAGLAAFSVIGVLVTKYLISINVLPPTAAYMYALIIISSIFHVLYSYISTVAVLKHFSVVSHAFANILKRLIVVCLLYITGSRIATAWNLDGLFFCIVGLSIYVSSKIQRSTGDMNYISNYIGAATKFLILVIVVLLLRSYYYHYMSILTIEAGNNSNSLRLQNVTGPINFDINEFYSMDLVRKPEMANRLSPLLTKRPEVIQEAQRIHMNIFKSEIGRYKYAMLFDYDKTENKGDPAIAVGEMILLRKLTIELIFACPMGECNNETVEKAYNLSKRYTDKELVVLFHGGGNVISSYNADNWRFGELKRFTEFHIVMFSQGIVFITSAERIKYCKMMYGSHKRLTIVWRDKYSYDLGSKFFPEVKSLMAPDMAYQIGFVPRFVDPTHDILWIKRTDTQSPGYELPTAPDGLRIHVADWLKWETPQGISPMENIFLITTNGLTFVQRGRVVITDRLHGHIFSTLVDIPHVFIDNRYLKISHYHDTWTAGLEHVIRANSSTDALVQAQKMLAKLDNELPKITGYFSNSTK